MEKGSGLFRAINVTLVTARTDKVTNWKLKFRIDTVTLCVIKDRKNKFKPNLNLAPITRLFYRGLLNFQ